MKSIKPNILIGILLLVSSCSTSVSNSGYTTLYPVSASATKYNQTLDIPDLSGLPIFSAYFDIIENKVIVRNGDNKLTLYPFENYYTASGNRGTLSFKINAFIHNNEVSRINYYETEDDITVEILYEMK